MTQNAPLEFDPDRAIDLWKTVVGVQQHFNDIGWRIRSLAITALTFTLGAAFFGYLNADDVLLGNVRFNPSAFVPLLGLFIWLLFWFADGIWYHRLLKGAQAAAGPLEERLRAHGIDAGLSTEITKASRAGWGWYKDGEMSSTKKLNIFYGAGVVMLCVLAIGITGLTLEIGPTEAAEPHPSHSRSATT